MHTNALTMSSCHRVTHDIVVQFAILLVVCSEVCARSHPVNNNATTTSPDTNSTSSITSDPRADLQLIYRTWISPCSWLRGLTPEIVKFMTSKSTIGRSRRRSHESQMEIITTVIRVAGRKLRLWQETEAYYVSTRRALIG